MPTPIFRESFCDSLVALFIWQQVLGVEECSNRSPIHVFLEHCDQKFGNVSLMADDFLIFKVFDFELREKLLSLVG